MKRFVRKVFFLLTNILFCTLVKAATWIIGPTQIYTLPSQVRTLVQDGDTILIDGGIYLNDATKWTKKDLVFIGLGIEPNRTVLQYSGDIPNGKGIFVFETPGTCDNPHFENIVFDGAQVSDADGANGAGIRFQANNITVNNCKFMNCQNGILEGNGSVTTSNVIITNSEFYNNGYQLQNDPTYSGYEHHIYISASADTLMVQNCYFHHPRGQANSVKTRAQRSFILYNFIDEEATGYGSWELNIAQGGMNVIMGNVFVQGPAGANHGIIGYDAATNAIEEFYFVNNTVVNQFIGNSKYFNIVPSSGITTFKVYNNVFASVPGASNTVYSSNIPSVIDSAANAYCNDYSTVGFTDPAMLDYSITFAASGLIDQGVNAGTTGVGYPLNPIWMYEGYNAGMIPRLVLGGAIDIGAFEFPGGVGVSNAATETSSFIYPNPASGSFFVESKNLSYGNDYSLKIISQDGRIVYYLPSFVSGLEVSPPALTSGIYIVQISSSEQFYFERLVIQ